MLNRFVKERVDTTQSIAELYAMQKNAKTIDEEDYALMQLLMRSNFLLAIDKATITDKEAARLCEAYLSAHPDNANGLFHLVYSICLVTGKGVPSVDKERCCQHLRAAINAGRQFDNLIPSTAADILADIYSDTDVILAAAFMAKSLFKHLAFKENYMIFFSSRSILSTAVYKPRIQLQASSSNITASSKPLDRFMLYKFITLLVLCSHKGYPKDLGKENPGEPLDTDVQSLKHFTAGDRELLVAANNHLELTAKANHDNKIEWSKTLDELLDLDSPIKKLFTSILATHAVAFWELLSVCREEKVLEDQVYAKLVTKFADLVTEPELKSAANYALFKYHVEKGKLGDAEQRFAKLPGEFTQFSVADLQSIREHEFRDEFAYRMFKRLYANSKYSEALALLKTINSCYVYDVDVISCLHAIDPSRCKRDVLSYTKVLMHKLNGETYSSLDPAIAKWHYSSYQQIHANFTENAYEVRAEIAKVLAQIEEDKTKTTSFLGRLLHSVSSKQLKIRDDYAAKFRDFMQTELDNEETLCASLDALKSLILEFREQHDGNSYPNTPFNDCLLALMTKVGDVRERIQPPQNQSAVPQPFALTREIAPPYLPMLMGLNTAQVQQNMSAMIGTTGQLYYLFSSGNYDSCMQNQEQFYHYDGQMSAAQTPTEQSLPLPVVPVAPPVPITSAPLQPVIMPDIIPLSEPVQMITNNEDVLNYPLIGESLLDDLLNTNPGQAEAVDNTVQKTLVRAPSSYNKVRQFQPPTKPSVGEVRQSATTLTPAM